jgi:hypothetical protein
MAKPKQRVQLLQLVLQKILGPRPRVSGRCRVARYQRATSGHNPSSHLVCSLSKVVHVMWLGGQGVSAPWPSPFVLHVRRYPHALTARREAKRLIRSSIRSACRVCCLPCPHSGSLGERGIYRRDLPRGKGGRMQTRCEVTKVRLPLTVGGCVVSD